MMSYSALDFQRSEVPGEAFVTVTDGVSGSRVSIEGAKDMFRKKNLMLPKAMRELLWEECIFATLGSDNKRGKRIRKPPQVRAINNTTHVFAFVDRWEKCSLSIWRNAVRNFAATSATKST